MKIQLTIVLTLLVESKGSVNKNNLGEHGKNPFLLTAPFF